MKAMSCDISKESLGQLQIGYIPSYNLMRYCIETLRFAYMQSVSKPVIKFLKANIERRLFNYS